MTLKLLLINKIFDTVSVAYGIEKMNREVSDWMRGLSESDDHQQFPFIATKGYDSVVWNRLYSRDSDELEGHQSDQASISYFNLLNHLLTKNYY